MSSALLLQYASGAHVTLLEASRAAHSAYCAARGIEYVAQVETRSDSALWAKYVFALSELERRAAEDFVLLILDADALIVGDEDFSAALPAECDFGAVKNLWGHFNCGNLWLRNSERVRGFLALAIKLGDARTGLSEKDQQRINELLPPSGLSVAQLGRRWNNYPGAAGPVEGQTQIVAWHGPGLVFQKLQALRSALNARE